MLSCYANCVRAMETNDGLDINVYFLLYMCPMLKPAIVYTQTGQVVCCEFGLIAIICASSWGEREGRGFGLS